MTSLPFSSHSSPIQNIFWHFLSVNQESLGHPFMIHSALIMVYFWAMWYSVLQTPSAVWLLLPLTLRYSDWRTLWQPQESWTLWGAAGAKKWEEMLNMLSQKCIIFFMFSFHFIFIHFSVSVQPSMQMLTTFFPCIILALKPLDVSSLYYVCPVAKRAARCTEMWVCTALCHSNNAYHWSAGKLYCFFSKQTILAATTNMENTSETYSRIHFFFFF